MTLYVLDTDHLTLLRRGHEGIVARVAATPPSEIAITVISIEEQFRGWFTQVRKARDATRLARAYEGLYDVIAIILPFSRPAVDRYLDLKRHLPRLGKQDLAIASVALEFNATIVTRNRRDFEQVPNLSIDDWAAG